MSSTSQRESAMNLVTAVRTFMRLGDQSTSRFNAPQACLYTGLELEEMGEKIAAIAEGAVTESARMRLLDFADVLKQWSEEFKRGDHHGSLLRATHSKLIDADFDIAWVAVGALMSTAAKPESAIAHGTFTNLDKFRDGQVLKDANGKIRKPADWREPDFTPYIDTLPLL